MNNAILKAAALAAAFITALSLAGCRGSYHYVKEPSRIFSANSEENISKTLSAAAETYGTQFSLQRKLSAEGALCHIAATCDELNGRETEIYLYAEDEYISSDYAFLRYGDEAFEKITEAAVNAAPKCKVAVYDPADHFLIAPPDTVHSAEDYLMNNNFRISIYLPEMLGKDELVAEYKRLARAMLDAGINCEEFEVGCVKNIGSVKQPDHITKADDLLVTDTVYCETQISHYGSLYKHLNESGTFGRTLIFFDGEWSEADISNKTEAENEKEI